MVRFLMEHHPYTITQKMDAYILIRANHGECIIVADVHKAYVLPFILLMEHMVAAIIVGNRNVVPHKFNCIDVDHVHEQLIALQFRITPIGRDLRSTDTVIPTLMAMCFTLTELDILFSASLQYSMMIFKAYSTDKNSLWVLSNQKPTFNP